MSRRNAFLAGLIGALIPVAAAAQAPAPPAQMLGRWINPRGSVEVETQACGEGLCGRIRWASAEALEDAREAGIQELIGTELLQDYRPLASGTWRGRVYVPDMGRTFYSTINVEGPNALRISGCILGGLICKSQVWRRQG